MRRCGVTDNFAPPPDLVARLKAALRGMPGPVALITTRDMATGKPAGLAASAVIPVSMAPPSMLVCVNRSASAHAVIEVSGFFCINLIGTSQTPLVRAFSSSEHRDQRFVEGQWDERHGLPYLPASPASLFCVVRTTLLFGTHEVFVGEVFDMAANGVEKPIGWLEGAFAQFTPINEADAAPIGTFPPQPAAALP
jgi:flavin reductase (DIM6/NTAB) family NADH-FMN oxidoreductase RutF